MTCWANPSFTHLVQAGLQVERVLDIGSKQVGFRGLGIGPFVHFLEQEQARNGIKFLGGSSNGWIEMRSEFTNRHQVQQRRAKHSLPTLIDLFPAQTRYDAVEGVKQTALSWIDGVTHAYHNSFNGKML